MPHKNKGASGDTKGTKVLAENLGSSGPASLPIVQYLNACLAMRSALQAAKRARKDETEVEVDVPRRGRSAVSLPPLKVCLGLGAATGLLKVVTGHFKI